MFWSLMACLCDFEVWDRISRNIFFLSFTSACTWETPLSCFYSILWFTFSVLVNAFACSESRDDNSSQWSPLPDFVLLLPMLILLGIDLMHSTGLNSFQRRQLKTAVSSSKPLPERAHPFSSAPEVHRKGGNPFPKSSRWHKPIRTEIVQNQRDMFKGSGKGQQVFCVRFRIKHGHLIMLVL